jgi:hypothetical protein
MENKNLSPPFNEFIFGRQKSYSFYDDLQNAIGHQIQESMNSIVQATFGETEFLVVGYGDGYNEFFVDKSNPEGAVFCFCVQNSEIELTQVADSVEGLYKICSDIKLFWEEHPGKRSLPKTPETVARMKQIMGDFKEYSPNAFAFFWQDHAMGELLIGLEL